MTDAIFSLKDLSVLKSHSNCSKEKIEDISALIRSLLVRSFVHSFFTKAAHKISPTRLRLGCHTLRIQTGKYEHRGAIIPVEERIRLVCKENSIEHEEHFLMYCRVYATLRHELH